MTEQQIKDFHQIGRMARIFKNNWDTIVRFYPGMTAETLKAKYAKLATVISQCNTNLVKDSEVHQRNPYNELQGGSVLNLDNYDKLGKYGRAPQRAHIPMSRSKYVSLYMLAQKEPLLQDPDLIQQISNIIEQMDKQLSIIHETKAMIEEHGPEFMKQTDTRNSNSNSESERDYSDEDTS